MSSDFVARAGAVVDRAHRIAGILLLCVITLGVLAMCQWMQNAQLNQELVRSSYYRPVIVVPDATAGMYSPTEDDRLVQLFTDFIVQTLNSYTPETIATQYEMSKSFFSPALLTDSAPTFERRLRDAVSDRRSSQFIADRSTIKVKKYRKDDVDYREVTLMGQLSTIVGATVAEAVPVEVSLKLEKGLVTPANPYGFTLVAYRERRTNDEQPTIGQAGSQPAEAGQPQQGGR